jgi:hypothetical protein
MKLLNFCLVLLLLIIGMANGLDKKAFEGWVKSGDSFSVQNQTYKVMHLREQNITVINFPTGHTTVIYMGNRTCSREWIYSICETKQRYEKDGQPVLPTINDPKIDIFVYLIMNITNIDLEIDRPAFPSEMFTGVPLRMAISLNRTGDEEITNITLMERYPDSFIIDQVSGCQAIGSSLHFEGSLNKSRHECMYTLTARTPGAFNSSSNVTYVALGRSLSKAKTVKFTVNETPLIMRVSAQNTTLHIGEDSSVNITIEALKDIKADRIEIRLPEHIRILDRTPNLTARDNVFSITNLQLAKRSRVNLTIRFTSVLEKNGTMNVSLIYQDNGLIKDIVSSHPVDFYGDFFDLNVFRKNDTWYLSIENPHEVIFSEIEVRLGDEKVTQMRLIPYQIAYHKISQGSSNATVRYRMVSGQLLTKNIGLNLSDDVPENVTLADDMSDADTKAPARPSALSAIMNMQIQPIYIYIGGGIVLALALLLFMKNLKLGNKSALDREIEELRKKESEEAKKSGTSIGAAKPTESSVGEASIENASEEVAVETGSKPTVIHRKKSHRQKGRKGKR